MDWDSPTTKKHIKEAETQGCELLGAGEDANYRLYKLPCGHTREVNVSAIRKGTVRCQTCLDEKLKQEAEAQGCKLLGPGKDANYRLYDLPCGHEQEVRTGEMRTNSFRCQACLAEKLAQEAEAQGCKLLGAGKDANYRLYALPCGHEQELGTGKLRKGIFECKTCVAHKLTKEAEAQDCKLLGAGKSTSYRLYELPCGHEQEVSTGNIRTAAPICKLCMVEKLSVEAEAQGCKLLGAGRSYQDRLYELPCGHEQVVFTGSMRKGIFECKICLAAKLEQEAEDQQCKLRPRSRSAIDRLNSQP